MTSPATQRCAHHPPRQAFALCMSCRKPLCQECATQWDGIWHCSKCLGAKRRATKPQSPVIGWISAALMTLLLLFLSARVLVWAGALIAGLS
jgi:hypothetical protein